MTEPQTAKRHEYRGDLRETALPEMLYTVYLHRVPGVIEATRGEDVAKQIYIRDGAVIHASSTDRHDSLGYYLLRSDQISREQFDRTMRERGDAGKRHGEVLIDEDILSPAELYRAIQGQIRAIVWSLFSWHEGQVTFRVGEFEEREMIRIHLPLRQVIFQGVKRAPDAKALVARLGRKETIFDATWTTEDLVEIALNEDELELLRLVDGERSLYEMCTSGPYSPAENARILYAFHVLRLMRRSEKQKSGAVKIKYRSDSSGG